MGIGLDLQDAAIKEIELHAQDYGYKMLVDRGFIPQDFKVRIEYSLENMAYQMAASFKLFGTEDEPRLLADYPRTLWDHIKSKLGLKHKRWYVYQQEAVVYPTLPPQKFPARYTIRHFTTPTPYTD